MKKIDLIQNILNIDQNSFYNENISNRIFLIEDNNLKLIVPIDEH